MGAPSRARVAVPAGLGSSPGERCSLAAACGVEPDAGGAPLPVACLSPIFDRRKAKGKMVEAAGIEPDEDEPNPSENNDSSS